MTRQLDHHVALITGAGRGFGAAQARLFVERGAIVVAGDIDEAGVDKLAAELGDALIPVHLDVTDETSWAAAVDLSVERCGKLDVLVNNAGIVLLKPMTMTTLEEYMAVVAVNQAGVFLGMRAVAPTMVTAGQGSIVNISSIEGLRASVGTFAYTATKFAVTGMTKAAAMELARTGVRVNSVHPGGMATAMRAEAEASGIDIDALVAAAIPMQRLGQVQEVAELSAFLASPASSYCTGSEFVADGGVAASIFTSVGAE